MDELLIVYKGYVGKLELQGSGSFHGEIIGIDDVITFGGEDIKDTIGSMIDNVNIYLSFCNDELNRKPERISLNDLLEKINPENIHGVEWKTCNCSNREKHWQKIAGRLAQIANSLDQIGIKDCDLSENELYEVNQYREFFLQYLDFSEEI